MTTETTDAAEAQGLLDEILARSASRDAALWEALALIEEAVELPAAARVDGERVQVLHVDYDGREDQGLLAEIDEAGRRRRVALTRVRLLKREPGYALVVGYCEWARGRQAAPLVASPAAAEAASTPIDDGAPLTLAVLGVGSRTARCRRVDDGSLVTYRPADRVELVPGALVTISPRAAHGRVEGEILGTSVDATALSLEPLALTETDPGPPAVYRLEALATPDALDEAAQLAEFGDLTSARVQLLAALDEDLRRLDAHRLLGDLALDAGRAEDALAHYAVGASIGDLCVAEPLDGVLPWEEPANRPYLACLRGCARALHRLGRERDGQAPLRRLLALDPDDGQGVVSLLRALGG